MDQEELKNLEAEAEVLRQKINTLRKEMGDIGARLAEIEEIFLVASYHEDLEHFPMDEDN